jgi:hypothetical protein
VVVASGQVRVPEAARDTDDDQDPYREVGRRVRDHADLAGCDGDAVTAVGRPFPGVVRPFAAAA